MVVVGSTLFPVSPLAISLDDALGGLVVSGMLVVIGVLTMRQAFDRRRVRQLIEETPTEDIESLSLGPSEVKGRAIPSEEAIRAPFTGDDCLVAQWRVEQYFEDTENRSGGWRTVSSGVESVPFYVDDGTGRVLVIPDERVTYEIEKRSEPMFEVDALQRPPEAVEEFFQGRGFAPLESLVSTLGLASNFDFDPFDGHTSTVASRRGGDRRYYQNLIRPDETVYVYGTVQRLEGARSARNPENLVIKRVPREDRDLEPLFMIADHEEARLTKQRRWALLLFPVGAVLTTAGLGGLLLVASAVLGVDLQLF